MQHYFVASWFNNINLIFTKSFKLIFPSKLQSAASISFSSKLFPSKKYFLIFTKSFKFNFPSLFKSPVTMSVYLSPADVVNISPVAILSVLEISFSFLAILYVIPNFSLLSKSDFIVCSDMFFIIN